MHFFRHFASMRPIPHPSDRGAHPFAPSPIAFAIRHPPGVLAHPVRYSRPGFLLPWRVSHQWRLTKNRDCPCDTSDELSAVLCFYFARAGEAPNPSPTAKAVVLERVEMRSSRPLAGFVQKHASRRWAFSSHLRGAHMKQQYDDSNPLLGLIVALFVCAVFWAGCISSRSGCSSEVRPLASRVDILLDWRCRSRLDRYNVGWLCDLWMPVYQCC